MKRYLLILALLATPALHAVELDQVNCRPPAPETVPDAAAVARFGWPAARMQAAGREAFEKYQCATAQAYLRAALDIAVPATDTAIVAAALHDLMRIALVANDRPAIDALGPPLLAAWDRGGVPDAGQGAIIYEQLFKLSIGSEAYVNAENYARRRLALMKLASRSEPAVRGATYDLARALYGQLRYADAEAAIASYATTSPHLPSPHYERQRTRDDMIALVRVGKLKEALALGEPALATCEIDLTRARQALGAVEAALAEAIPAQRAAADTAVRRARGRLNGATVNAAQTMGELGEIHHAMNKLTRAEALYNMALDLYKNAPPSDPTQLAMVQSALGTLYRSSGRPELALPLQRSALELYLTAGGPQHPDVLETEAAIARAEAALAERSKPAPELAPAPSGKRKSRG